MSWLVPLFQGNKQAKAITNAANTQVAQDQKAIDENARQFDKTEANLAPWLDAGRVALGGQMDLLGLGGGGSAPTAGGYNIQKLMADNPDIAAWVQAGHGDPNATGQQTPEQAVNYWIQDGIAKGDPRAINAPRLSADDVAASGPGARQQAAIDQLKASPLYQSIYRNGVDTINANASATGGLRGGNTQRSLAGFGADALSSVIQQQLQNLGGISGAGRSTGTDLGQLGANSATTIGNLYVGQGQDRAGGILGSSQAKIAGQNESLKQLTDAVAMIAKGGGF